VDAARQFPQGDQVALEVADLIFVRLAHIQKEKVVALFESLFQFAGGDFGNVQVALRLLTQPRLYAQAISLAQLPGGQPAAAQSALSPTQP